MAVLTFVIGPEQVRGTVKFAGVGLPKNIVRFPRIVVASGIRNL